MANKVSNLIQIDSGVVKIQIQVDANPPVDLEFNPNNKLFAERLHAFYYDTKAKLSEVLEKYQGKEAEEFDQLYCRSL